MLVTCVKIRLFEILAPLMLVGLDNGAKSGYFSTSVGTAFDFFRSHLISSILY